MDVRIDLPAPGGAELNKFRRHNARLLVGR